jgi:hypothetical protein
MASFEERLDVAWFATVCTIVCFCVVLRENGQGVFLQGIQQKVNWVWLVIKMCSCKTAVLGIVWIALVLEQVLMEDGHVNSLILLSYLLRCFVE